MKSADVGYTNKKRTKPTTQISAPSFWLLWPTESTRFNPKERRRGVQSLNSKSVKSTGRGGKWALDRRHGYNDSDVPCCVCVTSLERCWLVFLLSLLISELRSCVKAEVAVLGSPSLISLKGSVDVKQH